MRDPAATDISLASNTDAGTIDFMTRKPGQTMAQDWMIVVFFVLLNAALKSIGPAINAAEYTDGFLQLQSWEMRIGIYPPLYEFLARAVALTGISVESAARAITLIAGALCVWPVFFMGKRLGGTRTAAVFAALLYTVSPLPWRWSGRIMTDALFLLFSTGAMVMLANCWTALRHPGTPRNNPLPAHQLALATGFIALAGFTRYQGALLAPLLAIVFFFYLKNRRSVPWIAVTLAIISAAAAAWWVSVNQQMHAGQFASRTAATPAATFFAWWNTLESFVLISPYYFGYPIFAAALLGMACVRRNAEIFRPRPAAVLWGIYAVLLLALQAAFGSFQYRYMMPLAPMVCALGGVGFAALEQLSARSTSTLFRANLFRITVFASLLYLTLFGLAILLLQRDTYGDQRAAATFIRKNIPASTPVFSNERYGPHVQLGSVKLSWWTGRPVRILAPEESLPAGSIVVLGTAYGGNEAVAATLDFLQQHYTLRPLTPAPFRSAIVPLMDDVMPNPLFNQNPLAWVLRYVPQEFATQVFEVQPKLPRTGGSHGS